MKFALALLFVVAVGTAVAVASDDGGESPSYVMPAAFPTPYYSQFLPPYQNFNPFYPLPSVSYVGPHRQPFRQWAPYYYYGGPIQWGAGPASSAPNPPVVVGPAQHPSFLSVSEKVVILPKGMKLGQPIGAMKSAFIESPITDAHLKSYEKAEMQAPKVDPIRALREKVKATKFAKGAIWADKFEKYWKSRVEGDHNKRISDMRTSASHLADPSFAHASLLEVDAGTEAEAETEAETETEAEVEADLDISEAAERALEDAVEAVEAEAESM